MIEFTRTMFSPVTGRELQPHEMTAEDHEIQADLAMELWTAEGKTWQASQRLVHAWNRGLSIRDLVAREQALLDK